MLIKGEVYMVIAVVIIILVVFLTILWLEGENYG